MSVSGHLPINLIEKGKVAKSKAKPRLGRPPVVEEKFIELGINIREEEIDGEMHYFNQNNHRVTREGILIREQEGLEKTDYTENGINYSIQDVNIPGTTIVRTKEEARKALEVLLQYPNRVHAWDTETIGVEVKKESIIGKGTIICATAFIGPDVDFGNGPRLFIDNFADCEGLIMEFKEYLEDPKYFKAWHNYGFDRHIFFVRKFYPL